MAWINAGQIARMHREKFPNTRMSRCNMEQAFLELFGFPQVMQSCLSEALAELERRENILLQIFSQLDKQHRIPIEQGKNIFMSIRGNLFSDNWWEMFLLRRQVNNQKIEYIRDTNQILLDFVNRNVKYDYARIQ